MRPPIPKSVAQLIEDHIQQWQVNGKRKYKQPIRPVITLSRLPGSGGEILGRRLAENLRIDYFDNEIIEAVAKSAKVGDAIVETLDEQDRSMLSDWISALLGDQQLWPYEYLHHLSRVVGTIAAHGHAVIVGRGAGFILPPEISLRILVVSPLDERVRNVAKTFNVSEEEARKRVIRTESERKAFIRRYFNADMMDSVYYDLIINTQYFTIDNAVEIIKSAFNARQWYDYSSKK
jgi:cytidylate kinase